MLLLKAPQLLLLQLPLGIVCWIKKPLILPLQSEVITVASLGLTLLGEAVMFVEDRGNVVVDVVVVVVTVSVVVVVVVVVVDVEVEVVVVEVVLLQSPS